MVIAGNKVISTGNLVQIISNLFVYVEKHEVV